MKKAKGTFWARCSIVLLAVVFGVLAYWSVGFLLDDIRVIRMPNREAFFKDHTNESLKDELKALAMQLQELEHEHKLISQQRGFIKDSSSSLKITVDNLFRLKNREQQLISKEQFGQVVSSLDKIIHIQEEFKTTANHYIKITNDKFALQKQIAALKRRIEEERKAAQKVFSEKMHRHRDRTTIVKMMFLVPLVFVCTILLVKKRKSIYRLIYGSTAVAIYIKTSLVIHDHFPSRYFKYILTICMLGLVGWGFGWMIRRLVRPKIGALLKQYRQAYERFLCPVCEYPIRTGPRKYLFWTRRTVHKTALSGSVTSSEHLEEPYTCPACGSRLFEKCETCGNISHSLLPNCQHCGAEKEITGERF
jgi:predicted RNA-binding Zn-ribbon protein involved in translation (DUF1610 family)